MSFELNHVNYAYSDGTTALCEVSTKIGQGERIAVLGANGSGKSTLLRVLDGLVFPTSGTCAFGGRLLTDESLREPDFQFEFRSKVGFVFQDADAQLFNSTVFEETCFGPRQLGLSASEVEGRAEDTLAFLGLSQLRDRAPFRLSGGEKRKVAIASVLAMNPEYLLMDEPVAGLDPRMQAWLVGTLQALHDAGKTTIVATHDLAILPKIADRVLIMGEDHRLRADVTVAEALSSPGLLFESNLIGESEFSGVVLK